MQEVCYITFPSTYWALRAERLLKDQGFPVRLRPVPRNLSSSCGICLEVKKDDAEQLSRASFELRIETDGFFTPQGTPITV